MHWIFEPGFFSNGPVQTALLLGGVVSIVSGLVGVFTVLRGQSFAGHALTDVSAAGGSLALLAGFSPVTGFVLLSAAGAGSMEAMGASAVRRRDLATGIVLGAADGLAAFFLYLDATSRGATGATQEILFGSIFTVQPGERYLVLALSAAVVLLLIGLYRPLMLTSVSPELAAASGIRSRLVGSFFMLALAIAVGLSSVAIGAILSTALLVGPAAAAIRVARRPAYALLAACVIGLAATWSGILLAYDSYYWGSSHNSWPVSFCIVATVIASYLLTSLTASFRRRRLRSVGQANKHPAGSQVGEE